MPESLLQSPPSNGLPAAHFTAPATDCAVYGPHAGQRRYGLTEAQLAEFRTKGYVVLRGVFGKDDVAGWERACDEMLARTDGVHPDNVRFAFHHDQQSGAARVWKIDPFLDLNSDLAALSRDRRILDLLSSIYDGREPRLFKDKLIYKPPGGRGNPLHQDYNWWQGFPKSLISVLLAVDPATRENGCTELFPGHERGFLHTPGKFDGLPDSRVALEQGKYIETQPGDIALFTCFVPHRAGANSSPHWRRQMFLTYNDSADGEHYQSHREHYLWYATRGQNDDEKLRKFLK